jgi:PhnB protein
VAVVTLARYPRRRRRRRSAMAKVKPVPDEYPQVIPYLTVDGAPAAIDFYTTVFGAKETVRMDGPDGKVGHAELQIGKGLIMLADYWPGMSGKPPKELGGSPVTVMAYVEDVDATFQKALDAGATVIEKVDDKFYGDRAGSFEDPFGHRWHISSHIEDVSEEEMARRAREFMGG